MISVYLPFYNEEKILEKNVKLVEEVVKKYVSSLSLNSSRNDKIKNNKRLKEGYKIILVDDNSNDNSFNIAKSIVKKSKNIILKHYSIGPSRRENLAKSMLEDKAEIIVFMDIDLASDLNSFSKLVDYIKEGYDIATGSRYKGIKASRSIKRKLVSVVYNNLIKTLFNSKIKDHQCGFKAFKGIAIRQLIKEAGYDHKYSRGWFWDAEILIRAQKHKMKIKEFPITWLSGKNSSFNFRNEIKMIRYILKLKI